jgi:hypothetical protein
LLKLYWMKHKISWKYYGTCLFIKTLQEFELTIILSLHFLLEPIVIRDVKNYIHGVVTMLKVVWNKTIVSMWKACLCCNVKQKGMWHYDVKSLWIITAQSKDATCMCVRITIQSPWATNMCKKVKNLKNIHKEHVIKKFK